MLPSSFPGSSQVVTTFDPQGIPVLWQLLRTANQAAHLRDLGATQQTSQDLQAGAARGTKKADSRHGNCRGTGGTGGN